jgi:hypothetical protein
LYNIQDIHTYVKSILFNLSPNPNPRNLRKENPNPNPRNLRKENPNPNPRIPRKELKSFVKPQKDIKCRLERWWMIFLKLQLKNWTKTISKCGNLGL